MPRVIFPPFQHKSGSTELEHALDARRLDEAFSELAGVLNGGIDEANFASALKFSAVSPGAPSVNLGIATGHALVTLSYSGVNRTNARVPIGVVTGSGWVPVSYSIVHSVPTYALTSSSLALDVGASGTGTSLANLSNATVTESTSGGVFTRKYVGAATVSTMTAGHVITLNEFTTWTVYASITFAVPVL